MATGCLVCKVEGLVAVALTGSAALVAVSRSVGQHWKGREPHVLGMFLGIGRAQASAGVRVDGALFGGRYSPASLACSWPSAC